MSLDEPESTDRNTPLGKRPWNNDTGFSTSVLAVDLNVIDVVSVIDAVDSVDDDVVEDVISDDDDDLVEAAVAGSVPITSVVSTVDAATAGDGVDCFISVTEVVVSAEPVIADVLNSDDVRYPVIDSREEVRCCLIDPSVVQRKRGTFVPAVKKGDVRACVCCLSYNCFEGREYCLKGCVCDCYETWEGRTLMERKIVEERERRYEEEEDQEREENWKKEREESWKKEREESWKKEREESWEKEREESREDLDTEYHHKDLCRRFIADTEVIIDIQPLCLRAGCSKCEFLQSTKWKRDGTIRKRGRLTTRPWIPWRDNSSGLKNLNEGSSFVCLEGRR